ncbi:hypothetical protein HPB51_022334 [Rhipicephalus microplus]|uniref:Uncharacterized protein n=1 Tax=Rhipicephalus microplus TaxID=6941 RepID=A0A9J6DPV0_RHIMP|nr:hypothetical protein HPB51_022334 [Rhipicephalus microplus]
MFEEAVKKSAIEGSEHKVPASNNERLIFSFLYLIIVVVALCVALVIVSQQTPPPASTSTALGLYDDVFEPAKFLASAAQLLLSEALNIYFTTRTELRNCGIVTPRHLGVMATSGHRDLLVRKSQANDFSRHVMAWASRNKYSHLYLPLAGVVDYVPNTTRLVTKALAASNVILKLMVTTAVEAHTPIAASFVLLSSTLVEQGLLGCAAHLKVPGSTLVEATWWRPVFCAMSALVKEHQMD